MPAPLQSIFYTVGRMNLLKHKSDPLTPLLKTSSGSHLSYNKIQGPLPALKARHSSAPPTPPSTITLPFPPSAPATLAFLLLHKYAKYGPLFLRVLFFSIGPWMYRIKLIIIFD